MLLRVGVRMERRVPISVAFDALMFHKLQSLPHLPLHHHFGAQLAHPVFDRLVSVRAESEEEVDGVDAWVLLRLRFWDGRVSMVFGKRSGGEHT